MTKQLTKEDIYEKLKFIEGDFKYEPKSKYLLEDMLILHVIIEKACFEDEIINDDIFFDITSRLNEITSEIYYNKFI